MKEFMGIAANTAFVSLDNGKLRATVELIVIHSEPTYSFDAAAQMLRQRVTGEFRVNAGIQAMREIANTLNEWADEAEEREEELNALQEASGRPSLSTGETKP